MKRNIYLNPTNKKSRLINYIKDNSWDLFNNPMPKVKDAICQNISITSDEKIKDGDYVYIIAKNLSIGKQGDIIKINSTREAHTEYTRADGTKGWFASEGHFQKDWHYEKIILTTDVDLIKDKVESIPDEFLIWFIKNSNCEFVEIEKYHGIKTSIAEVNAVSGDNSMKWKGRGDLRDYKVIIPKEQFEQKNIYLLPTPNKSQLYYNTNAKVYDLSKKPMLSGGWAISCNIYITSGKKAKVGDYAIAKDGMWKNLVTKITGGAVADIWEEIILTNDQKLLKDDVQDISYDFLEWFVANTYCKTIKFNKYASLSDSGFSYELIFPKLPQKCTCERPDDNACDYCDRQESKEILEGAKKRAVQQETIEKIARDMLKDEWGHLYAFGYPEHPFPTNYENELNKVKLGIYEGQKLQSKTMYSESEVLTMLEDYDRMFKLDTFAYTQPCKYTVKEWFDKNKKKQ